MPETLKNSTLCLVILLAAVFIFPGFGIVLSIDKPYEAIFVLSGVITGSILWWFSITGIVNYFRARFSVRILLWFNRIAGAAIVLFVIGYAIQFLTNH